MKIEIVRYDLRWKARFEEEKKSILSKLGAIAKKVHHIGSTSVDGLAAKPIIDMMLEVSSLECLDEVSPKLESLGYEVMGAFGIEGRRYFRKGGEDRTHQIHAFKAGDANVFRHLAFRDYLKSHPAVRSAYQRLKIEVAQACENDIDRYCEGKDAFIKLYESKALEWIREQMKEPPSSRDARTSAAER